MLIGRKILEEGAWVYTEKQNENRSNMNDYYFNMISNAGVHIYKPTDAEQQLFIKACEPVYDYFVGKGLFTKADPDAMRNIIASK